MVYFGQQLESFSKAIDIVTDDVRVNILTTLQEKLNESLGIRFLTLHTSALIDGCVDGLVTTDWLVGGNRFDGPMSIRKSDHSYASQVSLAFGENEQLWIVRKDKESLDHGLPYLNLYDDLSTLDIPVYLRRSSSSSKTSIIFPLSPNEGSKPDAVINFESNRYLDFNPNIADELKSIAESIYRLYKRNLQHSKCISDTRDEINRLRSVESYIKPAKPSLFFAFPGRAKPDVINLADRVFHDFSIDLRRWDQDTRLGSIGRHIYDNIKSCDFGVCYLSEDVGDGAFADNANVLIELGMFWYKNEALSNVIVIRESSEQRIPFDIADRRILRVSRNVGSGQLDESRLEREFRRMLRRMIDEE